MESYFTNLDFPEIFGVPFPETKTKTFWRAKLNGRVFGRDGIFHQKHLHLEDHPS